MKVLHLIYSKQVAGAEKYLLDLLPGLKNSGINCELICVTPEADQYKFHPFCEELIQHGVNTQLLAAKTSNLLSTAKRIAVYASDAGVDYIHAHLFKADAIAVLVKMFFKKKILIISTKHGYQESYFKKNITPPWKIQYNLYYFISRFINSRIDYQITISNAMAELYQALGFTKKKMPFIHHGIRIDKPAAEQPKVSQQLIMLGRIEEIKGHIYFFKAMPEIIKKFPKVKLLILGNGTEKENLQRVANKLGITKYIEFLGFQSKPANYLIQSEIIILPSLFEPFGLVYIESFALKVPVVAFDVKACNEIITHNETGILVPAFDSKSLAEKVIYLLENTAERERIVNNAFHKYQTYFNTGRMLKETVEWYRSIGFNKQ
ncbi:glycosyltransferase [Ferruginibacter sp.]